MHADIAEEAYLIQNHKIVDVMTKIWKVKNILRIAVTYGTIQTRNLQD